MVKKYRNERGYLPVGSRADSQFDYYVGEELLVSCWCEAQPVMVPRTELLIGLTRPCRIQKCRDIAMDKGGFVPELTMYGRGRQRRR